MSDCLPIFSGDHLPDDIASTADTPPPPAAKLVWLRALGVAVVTGSTVATVLLAQRYPAIASLNAGIAWLAGKLLGTPLQQVMQAALSAMKPQEAVALTVRAVQSMPPAKADAVAHNVLQEIAAHAVGTMEPAQAEYITRAILETMPPVAKARVLEHIVFVSKRPPLTSSATEAAPPTAADGDSNGDK